MGDPVRTGFQSKYFYNPAFRRQSLGKDLELEEELLSRKSLPNKDRSPPKQNAPEDKLTPEEATEQKLDKMVEQSRSNLLYIKTAIPFNPFPHKVIVDIHKVTIIYKYFFFSEQVHSVYIKDISDVLIETSWIFSTLKIVDVGFTDNSIDINYLTRGDAVMARKIIQGLIVAHKNGLDLSKYESPDLSKKLEELGRA